ncbi:MAG: MFS transporter [Cyanobacteria bacterium K_DeepCast_35m_m1_288]|nr:MFS transporter [Cyanobacteria bacterium K_DeepCast_35m_m1_288]
MLSTGRQWWHQFPAPLRELATVRLVASFGAGGVLYLTPMVFHQADFSASQVGSGLAVAALAGTFGRFASGWLLDLGLTCGLPVLLAGLCGSLGDALLLGAQHQQGYVAGQVLLGLAGGLYWPAVELAVPLCAPPMASARGYALSRTADAGGVAGGTLAGALLAQLGQLRGVYLVDMTAIVALAALLLWRPLPRALQACRTGVPEVAWGQWLPALLPMLLLSVVATAIPALMQSALPLDLVRGGLERDAQPEAISALLIGLPLAMLLLIQWPVGQALARRSVAVGLGLSMVCFTGGTVLLALSALSDQGIVLVVLALMLLALGQAAFLPTSTEAVVELSPEGHGGLAMALFSQCFALSAFGAPLLAGLLLDGQGHGLLLWLLMSVVCGLCLLLIGPIRRRAHVKG